MSWPPDRRLRLRVRVKLAGTPASRSARELKENVPSKLGVTSASKSSRARLDVAFTVCVLSALYQLNWLLSWMVRLVDDARADPPPNESDLTDALPSGRSELTRTFPSGSRS